MVRLDLDQLWRAVLREQFGPVEYKSLWPQQSDLLHEALALFGRKTLGIKIENANSMGSPPLTDADGKELGNFGDFRHRRRAEAAQDGAIHLVTVAEVQPHEGLAHSKVFAEEVTTQLNFNANNIATLAREMQLFVVETDSELTALPGERATLVTKRLGANALVHAMPVSVDEQLWVATELPNEIDASETAGSIDVTADLVQEHVDLVKREVDLVLVAEKHAVATVEKAGKGTLHVFDQAPRAFCPQSGGLVG
jgi:hypothetical protein